MKNRKSSKTVVIRTDGSQAIGMGHIMRCIGLAQEFRRRDFDVLFALGMRVDAVTNRLRQEGFRYWILDTMPGSNEDLESTIETVRQTGACLVVVDGYMYQGDWLAALGNANSKVMLWTDYVQSNQLPVDVILDQTPQANSAAYRCVCPYGRIFTGLKYCVLREEFLANPDLRRLRTTPERLLVTMGGSDPRQTTLTVLNALVENKSTLETRVVVGPTNPFFDEIQLVANNLSNCRVQTAVSNMSSLIGWADIAITAAGITLWEFAWSGLPAIAISIADNQRKLSESVQQFGGGLDLGEAERVTKQDIWSALKSLTDNHRDLQTASTKMMQQVDGLGASRLVDELSAYSVQ